MLDAAVQRIAFAPAGRIAAFDHLRALACGDLGGVVGAVVGHHHQAIAGGELRANVAKRRNQIRAFIVCGNDNGKHAVASNRFLFPLRRPLRGYRQQNLNKEHNHRNQQQTIRTDCYDDRGECHPGTYGVAGCDALSGSGAS